MIQVRKCYSEMFNALFYVLCILREALSMSKAKQDDMRNNWADMEQKLRVATAKAAMEKRLREESLSTLEVEKEALEHMVAASKEEMAAVHKDNQA
jgi:gamma-glutamylcysteine synthetase